jgi:hypothetical protein
MPKRRLSLVLALVIGALAAVPVVALAWPGGDSKLVLGFDLRVTPTTAPAGTFVASGSVDDSGATAVQGLSVVPFGRGDRGHLSGTQTFTGARGTIVTRFEGIAHDIDVPHQWGDGRFEVVSGTGDYADLRGQGRFLISVDFSTGHFIGTEEGRVR